MDDTVSETLKQFKFFEALGKKQRLMLARHLKPMVFVPGDAILRQGQEGYGLFFLTSGTVEISTRLFGDSKLRLAQLGAGDVFGEISLFSSLVVTASVRAKTQIKVYVLESEHFRFIRFAFPEMADILCRHIMCELCDRVRDVRGLDFTILSESRGEGSSQEQLNVGLSAQEVTLEIIEDTLNHFNALEMDLTKQIRLLKNEPFLKYIECFSLKRHQVVYYEEEAFDGYLYLIAKGAVQTSICGASNFSYKMQVNGPGDLIGTLSFFDNKGRYGRAFCREDALLLGIKKQASEALFSDDILAFNEFNDLLFQSICSQLNQNNKLRLRTKAFEMLKP